MTSFIEADDIQHNDISDAEWLYIIFQLRHAENNGKGVWFDSTIPPKFVDSETMTKRKKEYADSTGGKPVLYNDYLVFKLADYLAGTGKVRTETYKEWLEIRLEESIAEIDRLNEALLGCGDSEIQYIEFEEMS